MNNISVTPKGGTVASELSGNQINLTTPSLVKLHLNQSDIKTFTRNGNDLVVTTKSGEVLVIHNFYSPNGDSDLVLEDDRGALWWVEDPGTEGFHYVAIDSTEGLLAENTTNDGTIAAFGIGGAALAGLGAMFAGSSGGGGGNAPANDGGGNNGGGNNGGGNNGGGNNGGGNNGGGNNGGGNNGGDTTPPSAVTDLQVTDNVGSRQGAIANGAATDDNTPTLSGTAEAGAVISVYDGSTLLGTVVVGADGRWSYTSPALADGQHSLSVTVTDAAGNVSPSTGITITVDTQAPAAATDLALNGNAHGGSIPVLNGSTTDDSTPTLSGHGEAGTVVSVYDGQTLLGTAVVGADGNWSFTTPALTNGNHSLTVTLTDAAGNVSPASPPFNVTVEAGLPPAATSLEIYDNTGSAYVQLNNNANTHDNTPTLTGLAGAGNIITLYNGETVLGSVVAGADGRWSFTPSTLADGSYAFHASATDATGNVTQTPTITINIDTVAPAAAGNLQLSDNSGSAVQPIAAGGSTHDTTPTLSGTAEAGSTVTVRDGDTVLGSVTVGSNGNWSFTSPELGEGSHNLTTTVTDPAGNVSPASPPITFTVDTTPPEAVSGLVVTDDVGSSQGPLTSGATTDDNTPTLSGSAEAGTVVRIYDGSTLLGSVAVGANGSWSFTTAALSNGPHSLTTTVTDAAGNVSPASPAFNLNVDAGVPPTTSSLVVTDDSGSTLVQLTNNAHTHDNTPILSGVAGAGDLITLFNGNVEIGSVVAGSDGQWSFIPTTLPDGSYAFHAVASNAEGQETDSGTITVVIDTNPPEAPSGVQLTDGEGETIIPGSATNTNTPVLSGSGEPGGTVTISDGTTVLGTVTVGSDGTWSYTTPTLSDGNHSLTSTVTDAAGNTGPASPPLTVTVDTQAPTAADNVQLTKDDGTPIVAGGTTNESTPVLSGTAEAGSTVTISDGNTVLGTAIAGSDGNWSYTTPTLGEGNHSLTTTVTDPAGNSSPATTPITVTVDTIPPGAATDLQLSNDQSGTLVPINNALTNDTTPVLSGHAEPGSTVTVSDGDTVLGSVTVGSDGNWSFTSPTLQPGDHSLTTTVTDAAGNTGVASVPVTFTVDTTVPAAPGAVQLSNDESGTPVAIATGSATNDPTPVLTGTADAGSTITVSDGGVVIGTTTVGSDGNWSFTTPALDEGNHSLTATVTSPAGNTSTPSAPIAITVDTTPPAAASDLQLNNDQNGNAQPINAGGTTNDTTPVFSGHAEPGSTVTVSDNGEVLGTVTVGTDGNWSFTPTTPLDAGNHSLTTTVTDPAGNTGPASEPITFTVDTTQPDPAAGLVLSNDNSGTPIPITNGATNDTTPVLSGTAQAGSTVTVLDGDQVLGTVTVGSDGSWSFTTPSLSQGDHSLTTTVTSPVGNVSEPSAPIAVTVDTQAPSIATELQLNNDAGETPVAIGSGGATNDTTPVLSGRAEPGSTVTVSDGDNVLGTVTVGSDGSWSFTPPALDQGSHSLTTTVSDAAGNSSAPSAPIVFTVDTTPPAAAGDLQLSNDNGGTTVPIASDGVTNDATPLFSGTAEPGSVVTIRDGETVLGSVAVDSDGNWRFTPSEPLADGSHSLTTTVTDAAGNTGPASDPLDFTVSTTPPAAAADIALNNDESGTPVAITAGSATNDATPVLSGTALAGSTVTVLDGSTVLGTVTVGSDGNWSFTTPALSQGEHSLTATVTDAAGNISAPTTPVTFSVDTQAPDAATGLQLSSDESGTPVVVSNGTTNDTTPVFSGSAEPGSTVTVLDGSVVLGTATVGSDGSWRFTPTEPLEEGSHSVTTTVTDPAGNVSAPSEELTFTVDTTPPPAPTALELSNNEGSTPVTINPDGITNDTTPALSGRAEPGSLITVSDGDTVLGSVTVGSDGNWVFTPTTPLGEGSHSLSATATDPAGNTGEASAPIVFSVDTTAPVAIDDLVARDDGGNVLGNVTNDSTPALSGSAEPGSVITIYDGTTVIGSVQADATSGNWSFTTPSLGDGAHSLSVTATDAAGNVSQPSNVVAVTIDTTVPATPDFVVSNDNGTTEVPVANGGATNDNTPVLSGSAAANSLVTIYDGNTAIGSVATDAQGNWRFTPDTLPDGSHALSVTVTDAAGNTSPSSPVVTITVDTDVPEVATDITVNNNEGSALIPIAADGVTNDTTPELTGNAEPGSIVKVYDGTELLGSVTVGTNGSWSFTSPALDQGEHSLSVTVSDAAGNTSANSPALSFTVDSVAPDAAANLALNNNEGDTPVPIANNGTTNDSTPALSGTAEANSIITVSDGNTVLGTAIADAQGNWSFSPTLTDGTHNLSVTVSDAAGNTSAPSAVISVTVDTVAPPAVTGLTLTNDAGTEPVTIPSGGLTNDSTPVLSGNGQAGSIVIVSDQNGVLGSVTVGENGTWRFTPEPALTDGTHNLSVTASDAAGNVSAPTNISVIVDATPPAVPDSITVSNDNGASPVVIGNATNDNTPFLSGHAEAGSIIIIRDGETVLGSTSVGSNGQWSFSSPTLADGSHSLTVTATDAAGNTSAASAPITFTIDTTVPIPATLVVSNDNGSQPVVVPNGTTTNDNTPLLSGTAAPGSVVTIFDGSVIIGSTTATSEGTWSFSSPALTDGSHTLTATVTDTFGNVSSPSSSFTVAIDVIAPQPVSDLLLQNDNGTTPVTIANGSITNDSTPVISGNAEANGIVKIYDGSTLLGSVVAGSNGSWSYSIPTLTDATHTLNVTVTDAGGNVSSNSSITLTVDTAVPEGVLSFGVYNDAGTTPVQVANDGSSNDTTPLLIGTGVAGTTINIFQDGTLIGTTTVGDDGAWRFETGSLTDGPYVFTVSVTNAAGNTSAEATPITINIDTSVPEAVGNLTVTDDVGDSTGPLTSGASTDDNQPTFAGSAEAGSIVSIYDGNTLLGTATVTNGNWSFTPGTALTNGDHSFTFTVTDAAGNVSETSPAFDLTIAAGLPETSSTLVISDDSGTTSVTLNDGAVTKDTTPVMMGSAGAGDIITIHDGETVLGSVTADAQGQWSFTPTLTDGAHALFITTVDPQGNTGASTPPLTITVDTQAPIAVVNLAAANDQSGVPVPIANNGLTNDSTPLITGTAEANGIVTIYDGNTVIGSTTANAAGAWSFNTPTLNQGGHTLSVTVTDAAGNVGPRSGTVNFTVDSVAPNASTLLVTNDQNSSTVPNGGSTNDNTPTLSGTAEANALVTIYDGGTAIGSATVSAAGSWTFTPTTALSDGNHALSVRVSDAAGNVSVASGTTNVVVDTVAPGAITGLAAVNNNGSTPVAIAAGGSTNDSTPALSGTAEPGSTVVIRDGDLVIGSVTAGSNGAWSFTTPTLGDGPHTLNITATDAAGNVGPNTAITLNVVTVAPDPVADLVVSDNVGNTQGALTSGASTDDNTPTLSGTATAGNLVIISEGNTVLGSVVADANGAWTFTTAALSDGSHALSVAVRDAAGNTSNGTNFTVVVDTIAPATSTLVVTNDNTSTPVPNGGTTSDNTPTLSGTAEAGSRITISDNGTVLGTAIAGANGAWTFTPTTALGDGSHPLSVTVTDAAGNVSGNTSATVIIDTTPPVAVTNLVAANNNGSTSVPIAAGGSTNDNTPALSGTAEAGSTVIIRDGTDILGSVVAGSNGAWSFTTPTLGEGAHTLNVTATDAAGNVSPNASLTLTVDTVPPAAVADLLITDDVGTIQGPLANGAVTDDARPTLSGTAEANAVVTVFDGSTAIGSVVAGANGAWSFTTATLNNGAHSLSVTVKDAAGNVSAATTPVAITVDTVAPTASTLVITNDVSGAPVASGGATNDTTPTLSGVAEAGSTVIIRDGANILGSVTAGSNGAWSFTPDALSQGAHTLSVTATDAAGNVSGSTSASVTIDTTPPVAVTNLVAANNNGSTPIPIAAGGSTNDNTPALSGTAEAGSTVIIRDGTDILGSVTAGSNGAWSFTTPTLGDGPHTLNVTATDAAGNVSPNASLTLTVDTVPPAAVANLLITDDVGTIQGALTNGAVTDDARPTLSGTAEANAVVTVFDGSTAIGSVVAGADGAWTFTTATLNNGAHSLSVTVKDAAGNVSAATTPVAITVDTVAPTASTLVITNDVSGTPVASGGATNDTTPTLSGVAEAGSTVIIRDGANILGSVTAGSNGAWSFTSPVLSQGAHTLSVTATDAAGNVSGSTSASVTIDTTPPAAVTNLAAANNNGSTAVTIPNNGITNDSTPLLTGSGEVGAKISVYDGGVLLGTTTVGSNGNWSFTSTTLGEGAHTLNVTATDAAGNVSPNASLTLTVDTVPPAAVADLLITDDVGTIQGPLANGAVTDDARPTLSGTAEANAVVTVFDGSTAIGSVVAGANGAWSFTTATLSNGAHSLSVTVKDAAGNVSAATTPVAITVDTVAPTASTLVITNDVSGAPVASGGATNDTTPTLSGVAEAGSTVIIRDGGTILGSVTAGSNGAWSFTSPVLSQGAHTLSVTATDAAGNVSGSTSASVTIDTTPPAAVTNLAAANNNGSTAVTIPNNGITNDSTPLLTGSGEVGAKISVYDGGVLLGTTTVGSNGSWSFISTTLTNGPHTLNVTATDAAGNVSPNASLTLTVDTVAPAASTPTIIDDVGTTPVTLTNGAFTRDTTPTLSGTAEVGAVVTIYDGSTMLGTVTVGSNGSWSFTTSALANGAHVLSTTVTDTAGNVSTGNTATTVNVDTVPPAAVTGLAINTDGTSVTGSGEMGATVTVRDAGGNALGTATVGSNGSWSVTLSSAQTTGAPLSVTQTDRAGNVSGSASLIGAIKVVAVNDTNEVDYSTTQATINNGTTSVSHTALLTVGLGNVLNASLLSSGNAYVFSVGNDDSRTITLNGSISSVGLLTNYSLNLYEQQSDGSWLLINTQSNYLGAILSLGTLKGANVTYNNLGTGTYAVIVASTVNISLLPTSTITTVSDFTTMAVTVAATVTGNLLTNDTSSIAGTIPNGTVVATVSGNGVSATGNTVINTTYGTLTIDSHGNYTYTLKAGLDIDTLPAADTFSYAVRDANGALTTATLTVTLHHGAVTSLLAANSLVLENSSAEQHDASGSIYGDSTANHSGTLTIANEHGDITAVSTLGTTAVTGDFGTLHIAANGNYTYTLNADVNVQSITHKEVFSYTLAGSDGTITTHSFTIELHPTIAGTTGADTLTSSAYDDTITSGAGADTLIYHLLNNAEATGGNGHDTWTDFNVAQGDKIDVSSLLIGWNDSTSNVNDFVKVDHTADGNTVLSIDRDGSGTAYSSTQLITLEGVNVSLEELLQQPHQNHTA